MLTIAQSHRRALSRKSRERHKKKNSLLVKVSVLFNFPYIPLYVVMGVDSGVKTHKPLWTVVIVLMYQVCFCIHLKHI